jgi:uncharacterized protein (UPF0276 family)
LSWFEALTENYIEGARPLSILKQIRRDYPIVLHGVSLNIGSSDPLNEEYLKKWKALVDNLEPAWVSDHLCWTGVDGENLHDLLPLPFTRSLIDHVVERIQKCQEYLGRRLVFENVSSYLTFRHSEMAEWEFVSEIARRSGSGILLDVNNVYVNSVNHGFDPHEYLAALPLEAVAQIHLAGHSRSGEILIDTHDRPVAAQVWRLYRQACRRFGRVATMVEWDADIPDFEHLKNEALTAARIQQEVLGDGRSDLLA